MRLLKYLWYDKVSLIILLLFIAGGIGLVRQGVTLGALLFVAALFTIYMVRERGLFIDRVRDSLQMYPSLLDKLDLDYNPLRFSRMHWFQKFVISVIFIGSVIIISMVVYKFITGDI